MDTSAQRQTCPRCGEVVPASDFLPWEGGEVCFSCHVRLTGESLDDLNERIAYRRQGRCIARMTDGHRCGAPASVPDDRLGGMVCQAHAPR